MLRSSSLQPGGIPGAVEVEEPEYPILAPGPRPGRPALSPGGRAQPECYTGRRHKSDGTGEGRVPLGPGGPSLAPCNSVSPDSEAGHPVSHLYLKSIIGILRENLNKGRKKVGRRARDHGEDGFSGRSRARAAVARGKGERPAGPDLSRPPQVLGFRCSRTLAMALISSSPQPLATPIR